MPREIPPERGGQGLGQRNARARRLGAAELRSIARPLLAKEGIPLGFMASSIHRTSQHGEGQAIN